jgi:hypothetical protein
MILSRNTLALYAEPLNEHDLYSKGATSWRTDIAAYRALHGVVEAADWVAPKGGLPAGDEITVEHPLGVLSSEQEEIARRALAGMLNDPSLIPNIRMLGEFQVGGVELQNGALDHNWHHDGLAGKRHGHAGDFFCITYFSGPRWDDDWGGHFEYGSRSLKDDWPLSDFSPSGEINRIAPAARTTLLGWNQNPCLVHRSAPLTVRRDRVAMIASVNLVSRH